MKGAAQGNVSATLTEGNWRFIKGRVRLASVGSDKDWRDCRNVWKILLFHKRKV